VRPHRARLLTAAAALLAAGCAAPPGSGDDLLGAAPAPVRQHVAQQVGHEPHAAEVALCTVLPPAVVGDLIGTGSAVHASGAGAQCTWRGPGSVPGAEASGHAPDLASADGPTLQAAMLDAGAFHAGRPAPGDPSVLSVDDVHGVGDEAFVVRVGEGAPTTLYVRDGQRALSLWLDDVQLSPEATERSLARTASLLLNLA